IDSPGELLNEVASQKFDFVDLGASSGGSMVWAHRQFGGKSGIGFDLDPKKVAQSRAAGHNVHEADIVELKLPADSVRFVVCSHTLEHLPSPRAALQVIQTAIHTAREFAIFRIPYFDADGMLAQLGLKFYHSDWSGHTNRLTTLD